MTVTYSLHVATSHFATFVQLLFWRKGSLFKLLWKELFLFLSAYFTLSITYRFLLSEDRRVDFEKLSIFCTTYEEFIPLTFVLGFYVSFIATRWWQQFQVITWTDRVAMSISTFLLGADQRGRLMRRTIVRYMNLAQLLTLRMVSTAVKKRFPTLDHVVEAGFMSAEERKELDDVDTAYPKYYVPCQWACNILQQAGREKMIANDFIVVRLAEEINSVRSNLQQLILFDWISVPIIYTQVVALVVYSYFGACLLGRQYLDPAKKLKGDYDDYVFPFFTTLQFLFYVGWLKVAEVMINPFGEDDDDFEVNHAIDRNLEVGYVYVDQLYGVFPALQQDAHWNKHNIDIPHTAASFGLMDCRFDGTASSIMVTPKEAEIVIMEENDAEVQKTLASKVFTALRQMSNRSVAAAELDEECGLRNVTRLRKTSGRTRPVTCARRPEPPAGKEIDFDGGQANQTGNDSKQVPTARTVDIYSRFPRWWQ